MRMKDVRRLMVLLVALREALACDWMLPVDVPDRRDLESVQTTAIGDFGHLRDARPGVPAHHHAGCDIARIGSVDEDAPVFAASCGRVVSIRGDGPFAQIIIYHPEDSVWTVYEHVAGILAHLGQTVTAATPLARIMNRRELNRYGWHFNHLHFEVMRCEPMAMNPTSESPERRYRTYGTECRTLEELNARYWDPLLYLKRQGPRGQEKVAERRQDEKRPFIPRKEGP